MIQKNKEMRIRIMTEEEKARIKRHKEIVKKEFWYALLGYLVGTLLTILHSQPVHAAIIRFAASI